MTDPAGNDTSVRRGSLDRLLLLTGLALLLAATYVGTRPSQQLRPPHEIALAVEQAWHDSGPCYVLLHGLDVPSDKGDGRSAVTVLEDGLPLAAHSPHKAMREGALGRFSHWGEHLYFSATDGSDPRHNGRSYVAVVPSVLPAWTRAALWLVAAGGLAFTLLGLGLGRARSRPILADAIPVLAASAVLLTLLPVRAIVEPHVALRRAEAQVLAPGPSGIAHAATRPGNVSRLIRDADDLVFEAWGSLPPSDERTRVSLEPSEGVQISDGVARLQPGGPGLTGLIPAGTRVKDIGDILLPARVRAGAQLELGLRLEGQAGPPKIRISVPLVANDERRPIRVTNSLALFLADARSELERVEVVNPTSSDADLLVDLSEVVISSPATTFLHTTHGLRVLERKRQLRPALWQSVAGQLRVPLGDAHGTLLKGGITLAGRAPDAAVAWRLSWTKPDGSTQILHEDRVEPDERWHDVSVRIPRRGSASRGGELLLEVPELPAGAVIAWSGWRLVDDSRPPRRVLLAVLDTLRRDAVSALGGTEASTPFLDALARDGVRFSNAYSQAHWTRPSMPSLMTSRYVAATGVEALGDQLPESYVTLAEAFAEGGYYTLADISNTNAGPAAGLAQGWDHMRHTASPSQSDAAGQLLSDELSRVLDQAHEEDLLLYIHLMDAHGPYGPAAPPGDVDAAPSGTPVNRNPAFDRDWELAPTDASRRHWYYRDVEILDRGLEAFFVELEERWGAEELSQATVAVTSDHGEYLGEYGQWGHDWFAELPPVVNIPLIVRAPGLPSDVHVELAVENIDLGSSLLELAGISPNALGDVDGHSLVPLIRDGDETRHGVALAGVGTRKSDSLLGVFTRDSALLGKQHTFLSTLDPQARPERALGASAANDQASLLSLEFQSLLDSRLLDLWTEYLDTRGATREDLWADVDTSSTTIDPLALQQLEALGYLGDD